MRLERYLIASLLFHFLIVAALLRLHTPQLPQEKTIQITIIDSQEDRSTHQTFVTDPELQPLKNALNELKKKADFLSKETRRVRKQMVARQGDKTQNNPTPTKRNLFPKPNQNSDLDGTAPAFSGPRAAERVVLSDSTIAEYIPDVKQGGFTSLNTDQFMYYTFYARINEQIRNRWVGNLRAFADSAGPVELNRLSSREQITELEVLLDQDGNYLKTIIHRKSESRGLDAAAALAIQNAAPFLNPPSEIAQEDGLIHLYYQFHVHWRPKYVARPN